MKKPITSDFLRARKVFERVLNKETKLTQGEKKERFEQFNVFHKEILDRTQNFYEVLGDYSHMVEKVKI